MLSGLFHPQMSCCKANFFAFSILNRKKSTRHKETHLGIMFYRQKSVQEAHFSLSLTRPKINEEIRPNDTL